MKTITYLACAILVVPLAVMLVGCLVLAVVIAAIRGDET